MGRTLSDGSFKPKPSAMKVSEWMQQRPLPMRSFKRHGKVKVHMGAGWETGSVLQWRETGVTVWLSRGQRSVTVRDNRNIKEATDK